MERKQEVQDGRKKGKPANAKEDIGRSKPYITIGGIEIELFSDHIIMGQAHTSDNEPMKRYLSTLHVLGEIEQVTLSCPQPKKPRSTQTAVDKDDSRAPRPHWTKRSTLAPLSEAKMGQRQCKSAYNIKKNKTTPESSPPPTPKSDYCNAEKAEENDLKKSLMKMLEEAFEEKMKNVNKEIEENTNKKLEEINKEIEEKKSKKLEKMNKK
ncbi:hypothetical protein STEG23_032923 [Scotinomys teguina]